MYSESSNSGKSFGFKFDFKDLNRRFIIKSQTPCHSPIFMAQVKLNTLARDGLTRKGDAATNEKFWQVRRGVRRGNPTAHNVTDKKMVVNM